MQLTTNNQALTNENVANYINSFLTYIDGTPTTLNSYTKNLKIFASWLEANNIFNPTRQDLINFKNEIALTHKPTTTRAYINTIKLFFRWCEYENIYKNIAQDLKNVKVASNTFRKDYLTQDQAKELLKAMERNTLEDKRNYAIVCLALTCGLRTIEIVRANKDDIKLQANSLIMLVWGKGRTEKDEIVKIPYHTEKAIREYLQAREDNNEALFVSCSDRNNGGRLSTRTIENIVNKALVKVNLKTERVTAHSLRHSTATLNLLNGGTLEETQQLLRHKNITTTMIYNHALNRQNNNSEQRIDSLLFD